MRPLARLRHLKAVHRCARLVGRLDEAGVLDDAPVRWLTSARLAAAEAGCFEEDVLDEAFDGFEIGRRIFRGEW